MDVLAMKRRGMSLKEIGDELGYHPATIAKWVKAGGPPPARTVAEADRVVDAVWADRLTALLVGNPKLLAKSLFEIVAAEGFEVVEHCGDRHIVRVEQPGVAGERPPHRQRLRCRERGVVSGDRLYHRPVGLEPIRQR